MENVLNCRHILSLQGNTWPERVLTCALNEQRKTTYTSVSTASHKARCYTAVVVLQQEGLVGKGRAKDLDSDDDST